MVIFHYSVLAYMTCYVYMDNSMTRMGINWLECHHVVVELMLASSVN